MQRLLGSNQAQIDKMLAPRKSPEPEKVNLSLEEFKSRLDKVNKAMVRTKLSSDNTIIIKAG